MELNLTKFKSLINQGEGFNLEFKTSFSDNIAKEVCAFANANGGTILLGVSDDGKLKGIKNTNRLKSQIQDVARNLEPSLEIEIQKFEDILIIKIPEGKNKPYSSGGKFYLRYGANTQQLKRDEIRKFFQQEGLILFDEKVNEHFSMSKDFNKKIFELFQKKSKISSVLSKYEILENLYLLENNKIKNAGVLLFCKNITKFFQQATITCVLYQGTTKYKILDRKEFDRDLYSNFNDALIYIQSKLNTELIIKESFRKEKLELPDEVLREALLNAISHRDYFVTGANVLVEIYLNRIEITNPGGLVKGITKKDLGKRSLSRNLLLFGLLQRMGLVEKIGSGILRMKNAMKNYGLQAPSFDV